VIRYRLVFVGGKGESVPKPDHVFLEELLAIGDEITHLAERWVVEDVDFGVRPSSSILVDAPEVRVRRLRQDLDGEPERAAGER
jgi:hypothetical protein